MSKEAMTTTQERAGVEEMQTLLQRLESLTDPSREPYTCIAIVKARVGV